MKSLLVSFQGAEHNGKGLKGLFTAVPVLFIIPYSCKALAFTISEILHYMFSKHLLAYKVAFFCS